MHVCKGPLGNLRTASMVHESSPTTVQDVVAEDLSAENLFEDRDGQINKVEALYNDCEMEDSINSNEDEEGGPGIMLGSFVHGDDPESVILTRYSASEIEDKDLSNDDGGIGPIEMTFETGVGHIDQLL